jgi:hypothetical protein
MRYDLHTHYCPASLFELIGHLGGTIPYLMERPDNV